MTWPDYELLDFGGGRKLERFGQLVFDRPAPQAIGKPKLTPARWRDANGKYSGAKVGDGQWKPGTKTIAPVQIDSPTDGASQFRLNVEPTLTGQVGLFPEQASNWDWIATRLRQQREPVRVLNLFGYTGASTLAALAAGAEVTHVDASKSAVATARENAALSGLGNRPARWIVEDTLKYCRRELRRGSFYHGVIIDPPTYGHGPGGEAWQITRDLLPLLSLCGELTAPNRVMILLTCHTPSIGVAELAAYLCDGIFGSCAAPPASGELLLTTADGRKLPSGNYARWPR